MIEVGKMKLLWVGSVDIYFVNVGSKVITSRNGNVVVDIEFGIIFEVG